MTWWLPKNWKARVQAGDIKAEEIKDIIRDQQWDLEAKILNGLN